MAIIYFLNFLATTGMSMLLRRLSYPNRLVDLEHIFGYSSTVLSNVTNIVLQLIEEQKGYNIVVFFNISLIAVVAQK